MPVFLVDATTPSHVLMDGGQRIGPAVTQLGSAPICTVIYGFSSKCAYDAFRSNSPLALTPYPLVKGYLRNQIDETSDGIKLVAIDAMGPLAPTLYAATMESVLDSMEKMLTHVNAAYLLEFDQEVSAYWLATVPEGSGSPVEHTK